jgi:ParB/RepB/Spo0J family partition protein
MKEMMIPCASAHYDDDRADGGQGNLASLARNIQEHGQINPVHAVAEEVSGAVSYRVIAGRRRLEAFRLLKWPEIWARVYDAGEVEDEDALSLSENTAREPMSPLDEGTVFRKMLDAKTPVDEIASVFCRTRAQVYQRSKLAGLIPEFKGLIKSKELDCGTAVIAGEFPQEVQKQIFQKIKNRTAGLNYILPQAVASVCGCAFGRKYAAPARCGLCTERTRYSDETLFPDMAVPEDVCLDAKCFYAQWRLAVQDQWKKYAATIDAKQRNPVLVMQSELPSQAGDASAKAGETLEFGGIKYKTVAAGNVSQIGPGKGYCSPEEKAFYRQNKLIIKGVRYSQGYECDGEFESAEMVLKASEKLWREQKESADAGEKKQELDRIYSSLPGGEKDKVVSEELKNENWDCKTHKIKRRYFERCGREIAASWCHSRENPAFCAAAIARAAADFEQLENYFPGITEFRQEHTATDDEEFIYSYLMYPDRVSSPGYPQLLEETLIMIGLEQLSLPRPGEEPGEGEEPDISAMLYRDIREHSLEHTPDEIIAEAVQDVLHPSAEDTGPDDDENSEEKNDDDNDADESGDDDNDTGEESALDVIKKEGKRTGKN